MNITDLCIKATYFSAAASFFSPRLDNTAQTVGRCSDISPGGTVQTRLKAAPPSCLRQYINLASARLGSHVDYVTDEFFGKSERMLSDSEPRFYPDKYDDHGKWMDGWESRRKREDGHDFAIIDLAVPGIVRGVAVDTSYFTGNFPPELSIETCDPTPAATDPALHCESLLPKIVLQGDSKHYHLVDSEHVVGRVKVNIFPDGGIARLRLFGEVPCPLDQQSSDQEVDLFALENGGRARLANNEHYGSMHNLNLPGPSLGMNDGWETRRRREPGNDWVILGLGRPGSVHQLVIDTAFFKGNFPKSVKIQAQLYNDSMAMDDSEWEAKSDQWPVLLENSHLSADSNHTFISTLQPLGDISHLRVNIIPDGGLARVRVYGTPSDVKK